MLQPSARTEHALALKSVTFLILLDPLQFADQTVELPFVHQEAFTVLLLATAQLTLNALIDLPTPAALPTLAHATEFAALQILAALPLAALLELFALPPVAALMIQINATATLPFAVPTKCAS